MKAKSYCFLGLCLIGTALSGREDSPVTPGLPKPIDAAADNALFGGLNLYVKDGEKSYLIQGYDDEKFLIRKEGSFQRVKPEEGNLAVKDSRKFSLRFIRIEDLEVIPKRSQEGSYMETILALERERARQQTLLDYYERADAAFVGGAPPGASQPGSGSSNQELIFQTQDAIFELENQIAGMEEQLLFRDELYDSLFIRFSMKPEETLDKVYLVAVAWFTLPGKEDEKPFLNIMAKGPWHLEGSGAEEIRMMMTGFPENFNMVRMDYHFFSGPEEIPHTYTREILPLSDDEAYEFLYSQFVANYSGPDRKPQLVEPLNRAPFDSLLSENELERIRLKIHITPQGETEVREIIGAPPSARQALESLLADLRFLPAIEDQVPVDKDVSLSLERVFR